MHRRTIGKIVIAASIALVASACHSSGSGAIDGSVQDYSISLDASSAASGSVTFNVKNTASQEHEFVIFKTDLPADQLPLKTDGDVDEEGAGVTHVDEIGGIEPGATQSLTLDLQPGNYVFVCNLPGHYHLGMHTTFTVS